MDDRTAFLHELFRRIEIRKDEVRYWNIRSIFDIVAVTDPPTEPPSAVLRDSIRSFMTGVPCDASYCPALISPEDIEQEIWVGYMAIFRARCWLCWGTINVYTHPELYDPDNSEPTYFVNVDNSSIKDFLKLRLMYPEIDDRLCAICGPGDNPQLYDCQIEMLNRDLFVVQRPEPELEALRALNARQDAELVLPGPQVIPYPDLCNMSISSGSSSNHSESTPSDDSSDSEDDTVVIIDASLIDSKLWPHPPRRTPEEAVVDQPQIGPTPEEVVVVQPQIEPTPEEAVVVEALADLSIGQSACEYPVVAAPRVTYNQDQSGNGDSIYNHVVRNPESYASCPHPSTSYNYIVINSNYDPGKTTGRRGNQRRQSNRPGSHQYHHYYHHHQPRYEAAWRPPAASANGNSRSRPAAFSHGDNNTDGNNNNDDSGNYACGNYEQHPRVFVNSQMSYYNQNNVGYSPYGAHINPVGTINISQINSGHNNNWNNSRYDDRLQVALRPVACKRTRRTSPYDTQQQQQQQDVAEVAVSKKPQVQNSTGGKHTRVFTRKTS